MPPSVMRSRSVRLTSSSASPRSVAELQRLLHALVALDPAGDVERARRHAGPQRLDHRVAARDELPAAGGAPRRSAAGAPARRPARDRPAQRRARRPAAAALRGRRDVPCARSPSAWAPCPAGRATSARRSRRSGPSWCRACARRPGARSCPPSPLLRSRTCRRTRPSGVRLSSVHRAPSGVSSTDDARGREPVADRVGGGEVALLARGGAGVELGAHERVEGARSELSPPRRRRRLPVRVERVDAEHVGHRPDLRRRRRGPPSSSRSASAVLPARTVSCTTASAGGTPRSSSIARDERARARSTAAGSSAATAPPSSSSARSTNPSMRSYAAAASASRAVALRALPDLDRRAVVRRGEQVAQRRPAGRAAPAPRWCRRVAERLAHLLAVGDHPGRCASSSARRRRRRRATARARSRGAGSAGRGRRRGCRTRRPRYRVGHRRALDVPARPAAPPRRGPGRRLGLARLARPSRGRSRAGRAWPRGSASSAGSMSSRLCRVSSPYAGQERTSK